MRMYKTGKRIGTVLLLCLCAVLVAGCGNSTAAYEDALEVFGEGDYAEAAAAFTKLGDYLQAETYAAYAQGLTYWEQGSYDLAEPYFEQTQSFMYGAQRYRFCHAYVLEQAGAFADAAAWYAALEAFEDAPQRAAYCAARAAMADSDYAAAMTHYRDANGYADAAARLDSLNFEVYTRAKTLMDEADYEQALTLFMLLGDHYDAPDQARLCKNYFQDQTYAAAEALIAVGDMQGAYEKFTMLTGYRDAATRADELAKQLGLDTAQPGTE